ncbi:trwN protein [Bartonella taylorii]|uniref:trwN protein n=1 Tax=Bartonella taylorii TaxID=33046 RepID=UPI001ABB68D0|nr:trwN protein [Bartonella taylorii]
MTVPNLMMLTAFCTSVACLMSFSTVIMQEARNDIYTTGVNDNRGLSHQISLLKEAIVIADQFRQDRHNFDANLRQIDVGNLGRFGVSFSDMFSLCKSLKVVGTVLTRCYEQMASRYESERTALQDALGFYNVENFENDFTGTDVQRVASRVRVKNLMLLDEESQEPVKLYAEESKQKIETKSLSTSSEELADVFAHKASGVHDAFTVEDSSSSERQQE